MNSDNYRKSENDDRYVSVKFHDIKPKDDKQKEFIKSSIINPLNKLSMTDKINDEQKEFIKNSIINSYNKSDKINDKQKEFIKNKITRSYDRKDNEQKVSKTKKKSRDTTTYLCRREYESKVMIERTKLLNSLSLVKQLEERVGRKSAMAEYNIKGHKDFENLLIATLIKLVPEGEYVENSSFVRNLQYYIEKMIA